MDVNANNQNAAAQVQQQVSISASQQQNNQAPVNTIVEEKITKYNGEVQVRRYLKGKFLGKGGFAKCYEFQALDPPKGAPIMAAKVVCKETLVKSRAKQKLMSEIKIHRSVSHLHVVKFEHFFEDAENVYIILELCQNQSLNELLRRRKRLHELEVQCYTMQIINALKYLHAHRIIHRDLKLGNLFLNDKMEIKLGDFGLATKLDFDGEKKRTICGTPNYIAPEVLEGKAGHSYEVDVWSLGVIIYTLIIGKPPFETSDVKTTYKRIRMNAYTFPDHVIISDAARDLITQILNGDPKMRPTLDEIIAHDFLNNPGGSIPKTLPQSFLACPPSAQYIKQFMPHGFNYSTTMAQPKSQSVQRLENTAPANPITRNVVPTAATQASTGTPMRFTAATSNERQGTLPQSQNQFQSSGQLVFTDRGVTYGGELQPGVKKISSQGLASSGGFKQPNLMSPQQQPKLNGQSSNGFPQSAVPSQRLIIKDSNAYPAPQCWVKKWVDYSSKYGLGYLLSNGATGVFFNDSTKILLDQATQSTFYYYERKAITATEKQDVMQVHDVASYPKELHKKVTLMQHFRSYLENHEDGADGEGASAGMQNQQHLPSAYNPSNQESKNLQVNPHVYVKKWMRTKHAIMFRLSNKIVQVNFQDHTEILLNSESRLVTYVNKKGERQTLPLSHALESNNAEMTKRLKYTKDILTHMLNNNQGGVSTAGGLPNAPGGSVSAKGPQQQQQPLGTAMSTYQSSSRGLVTNPANGSLAASGLSSKRTLISQGLTSELGQLHVGSGNIPAQGSQQHFRPISSSKPVDNNSGSQVNSRRPISLISGGNAALNNNGGLPLQ